MLTEKLKALNLDRVLDLDEAVELSSFARILEQEFVNLELPVPGWLQAAGDTLREEIAKRTRASDLALMRDLESQLEGFKTVTEKRRDAEKRLADLQKKLGMAPAKAGR